MYNKKLFTSAEAAKYLGTSVRTLNRWEDLGKITSVKIPNSNQKFYPKIYLDRAKRFTDSLDYGYFKRF